MSRQTAAPFADPDVTSAAPLLDVRGLGVDYRVGGAWRPVVRDVDFALHRGQTLGLVGESGSGKSTVALAVLGLLDARRARRHGTVTFDGIVTSDLRESALRGIRGERIAFIGQNSMGGLNPVMRVGQQIAEPLMIHRGQSWSVARARALELMELVQIPAARQRLVEYPHQLSGGMKQRVGIAMALAADPDLLIADEPTTALDVTIQAQILRLLSELCRERDMAMIFVSHDLSAVARVADLTQVMYAGRIAERGPTDDVLTRAVHPYAAGLVGATPRVSLTGASRPVPIPGSVASAGHGIEGCAFAPRCAFADELCRTVVPLVREAAPDRFAACHYPILTETGAQA